jgi:hypothetical protein
MGEYHPQEGEDAAMKGEQNLITVPDRARRRRRLTSIGQGEPMMDQVHDRDDALKGLVRRWSA